MQAVTDRNSLPAEKIAGSESSELQPNAAAAKQVTSEVPAASSNHESVASPPPPAGKAPSHSLRKRLVIAAAMAGAVFAGYRLYPTVVTMLNTVSTDDAYVNGHVTLVAPRVAGQVSKVLVDDNFRVKKGDLLVQLDREPFQVEIAIKQAAVTAAEADLAAAVAQVHGQVAAVRANRYLLQHEMEDVNTQVANLAAAVATLNSKKAALELGNSNLRRGEELGPSGGISKEDLDERRQAAKVDEAAVDQALQQVYAIRVGLGLPAQPPAGQELASVPPNLDQDFSSVRQGLGTLLETAAQLGYVSPTWNAAPKQAIEEFYKEHPEGDVSQSQLVPLAPAIQQANAKLLQARRDLDQAKLNLRYCDVVSEIDGVVTRRNVNPGNNVQAGQSLMAVRSLTEIWIDANFKETQLANLRIGQRVSCDVDMYGSRREFEGRITGFTMGTGQTLALLPPQNATGNFVKIVQRLPVRIELSNYDPDRLPLFVGLSVTPYVYFKEPPEGPRAGDVLQPATALPVLPTEPTP